MHTNIIHFKRKFFADTTALVIFFTITGILNERFIAEMSWFEVAVSRTFGGPLMVLTARPYGIWRDVIMARWALPNTSTYKMFAWDTFALVTFQVPIYAFIIWVGGAEGAGLVNGVIGATAIMMVCGRPYGVWLELVRRWFKVSVM